MPPRNHYLTRRKFIQCGLATTIATLLLSKSHHADPCSRASLDVISRDVWGARKPNLQAANEQGRFDPLNNPDGWLEYPQPLSQVLNTVVVHHTALPSWNGPREIQLLHMNRNGFADIGYHFLIDLWGKIYEGRSIQVRGAHTGGFNTGTVGVALLGNFDQITPSVTQMARLTVLVACLADNYDITHLAGHRDFQPGTTTCPGHNLAPRLPDLARKLGRVYGTGGYVAPRSSS